MIMKILKRVFFALILLIIAGVLIIRFVPQLLDLPVILLLNQIPLTEFEVRGEDLIMNGDINSQTYDQFEQIMRDHPQITTLVEEVVSGSIDDDTMIKLAYRVRELGLNSKLLSHSQIDSGGVDLFLAGVERTMERGAHIGVHSWSDGFREAADFPRGAVEHEQNRKYVEDMLGQDDFYWFTIEAAPAAGIHVMSEEEINAYGLLTQPISPMSGGKMPGVLADKVYAVGDPESDLVIVNAQGGPMPYLFEREFEEIFDFVDLKKALLVNVHQAQTLRPHYFADNEISFEEAKKYDSQSVQILADVVRYYKNAGKRVYVMGISFGAFVVQDLLATHGDEADGYLVMVGRVDMPPAVWETFAQGKMVGFIEGVKVEPVTADGAGMGGEGEFTDQNMARLAAGLGYKRFSQLLQKVDLSDMIYIYGQVDEQVGRLSPSELQFLQEKGVTVIASPGDHSDTIDGFIRQGLSRLVGKNFLR